MEEACEASDGNRQKPLQKLHWQSDMTAKANSRPHSRAVFICFQKNTGRIAEIFLNGCSSAQKHTVLAFRGTILSQGGKFIKELYKDLYQFSIYIPPMDFTIHQYLLAVDPAVLFATGTIRQAEQILPQIKTILKEKALKYIFVSHMESDECGGLSVFFKEYPDMTVICSALCARELPGFGYQGKILVGSPGTFLFGQSHSYAIF